MKNQMEKQLNLAYFIKKEGKPSLGILGIVREAFKNTIRNGRLVIFITFILFSYYFLLGLADHLLLAPVLRDMVAKSKLAPKDVKISKADPILYKAIGKDVRYFLTYELVVLSFSCLVLTLSFAASVHSAYEAYTAKRLSLKETLLGTRGRLKRPLITNSWMILIGLASAALFFILVGVTGVMTGGEGSLSTATYSMVLILGVCYFVYISALWMLSFVVSVIEENLSGLKAIDKANELMKGKKLQGCVLIILLMFANGAIFLTFFVLEGIKVMGLAISIPKIWSYCLMKLFVFVVFTLFYHECKKSHAAEENPNIHAPISALDKF